MENVIYYLPIEPLEERYTEQWYRWFPEACAAKKIPCRVLDGMPLFQSIEVGTFLDVNSTLHYKVEQLKTIAKLFHEKAVQPGDMFFVGDIEFWGVEAIKYLSVLNNVPIVLAGVMHAGSYTRGDFIEPCSPFAKYHEQAWLASFDLIFVGSVYHKNNIIKYRCLPDTYTLSKKIIVTGNPLKVAEIQSQVNLVKTSIPTVICPNRPDLEKNPEATMECFSRLKRRNPEWRFILCTSRPQYGQGRIRERALQLQSQGVLTVYEDLSKGHYYRLLASSHVMTSNTIDENFGYCIAEACAVRTVPVVEHNYSHLELLDFNKALLFKPKDPDDQIAKIEALLTPFPSATYGDLSKKVVSYALRYENAFEVMIEYMKRASSEIVSGHPTGEEV